MDPKLKGASVSRFPSWMTFRDPNSNNSLALGGPPICFAKGLWTAWKSQGETLPVSNGEETDADKISNDKYI